MAWVIFRLSIIYTMHSIFKTGEAREGAWTGVPLAAPLGGATGSCCGQAETCVILQSQDSATAPIPLRQFPELNDSDSGTAPLISSLSTQQKLMSGWW